MPKINPSPSNYPSPYNQVITHTYPQDECKPGECLRVRVEKISIILCQSTIERIFGLDQSHTSLNLRMKTLQCYVTLQAYIGGQLIEPQKLLCLSAQHARTNTGTVSYFFSLWNKKPSRDENTITHQYLCGIIGSHVYPPKKARFGRLRDIDPIREGVKLIHLMPIDLHEFEKSFRLPKTGADALRTPDALKRIFELPPMDQHLFSQLKIDFILSHLLFAKPYRADESVDEFTLVEKVTASTYRNLPHNKQCIQTLRQHFKSLHNYQFNRPRDFQLKNILSGMEDYFAEANKVSAAVDNQAIPENSAEHRSLRNSIEEPHGIITPPEHSPSLPADRHAFYRLDPEGNSEVDAVETSTTSEQPSPPIHTVMQSTQTLDIDSLIAKISYPLSDLLNDSSIEDRISYPPLHLLNDNSVEEGALTDTTFKQPSPLTSYPPSSPLHSINANSINAKNSRPSSLSFTPLLPLASLAPTQVLANNRTQESPTTQLIDLSAPPTSNCDSVNPSTTHDLPPISSNPLKPSISNTPSNAAATPPPMQPPTEQPPNAFNHLIEYPSIDVFSTPVQNSTKLHQTQKPRKRTAPLLV